MPRPSPLNEALHGGEVHTYTTHTHIGVKRHLNRLVSGQRNLQKSLQKIMNSTSIASG